MIEETQEWQEYQCGLDYNNKLDYYAKNDLAWNFYNDNQCIGIKDNGLPKYQFNICKSAIKYFIAFVCSQKVKMQYSAQNIPDDPQNAQQTQVKEFTNVLSDAALLKWEKDKMDTLLRDAMLDGALCGDFAAHVFWDGNIETGQLEKGDFKTELIDGVNVMFGNPNNKIVEKQPYILIIGRDSVKNLKKEAKENGIDQMLIDTITADEENTYQAGQYGKIELNNKGENGKALYIIRYWKENGTVLWNKSTKSCPIVKRKNEEISRYPIAWGNWETVKNTYHGNAAINGIIDNQIGINQLFAMISYFMKKQAFGSVLVDNLRLPDFTNKLGQVFKVNGPVSGGTDGDIIKQLEVGNFNEAVLTVVELAIRFTKEFIGANDTLLGQVNPEQASGVSITATAKQASMPLGNIQAARDQFVEDIGLIWGEFFTKKYKNRQISYKKDDKVMITNYSTEGMDNLLLQCNVDVGPSTYWSEIAGLQTLDNLLKQKEITKLQYFTRIAKMNIIPDIQGLINDAQAEINNQNKQVQYEQMAQFVQSLPEQQQLELEQLRQTNPQLYEQTVIQMMGGNLNGTSGTQMPQM